jgi:DNA-binding transcriptional LysR family regulator
MAALSAIRAGFGIGVCQVGLARRDPALVRLFPELAINMDTWVVMHEDLRRSAPARALFGHLAEALIDYAKLSSRPAGKPRR